MLSIYALHSSVYYVINKRLGLSQETLNASSQLFVINPKNAGELKLLSTLAR